MMAVAFLTFGGASSGLILNNYATADAGAPSLADASAPLLDPPCYCAAATSTIGTSQPNVLLLFLSDGAPRSWAAATQCTTTTTAAALSRSIQQGDTGGSSGRSNNSKG